ncbi:MAG: GNAT family N-acetyltransferase [Oscillospiraceae bacterium]|nr:GNAT family N-acetyltransferase [Oscillospiraceae bacterium]
MEKSIRADRLELHVPQPDELWFRQKILSDPATMAYNAPWFPPDGCIPFPESAWDDFYAKWIGHRPDRFYAYLRRISDGAFVGEVDYRRTPGSDRWDIGVVVSADCRGLGYGMEGLRLLIEHAFLTDGVTCLQNDFETSRGAACRIHKVFGFRETGTKDGIIHLELTRDEFLTK